MKASVVLSLASVALAAPAVEIEKRQMTMTMEQLTKGTGCKDVTFIWVRGTTELGNLVCSPLHYKILGLKILTFETGRIRRWSSRPRNEESVPLAGC